MRLFALLAAASLLVLSGPGCSPEESGEPPVPKGRRITSFSVGFGGGKVVQGVIDHRKATITVSSQKFSNTPFALRPVFEAEGTVSIGGEVQTSGESGIDIFRGGGNVVYTVTDSEGESAQYTLTVDSPLFSGLPVAHIEIEGGVEITQKREEYNSAVITLIDPASPDGDISSAVGIRGRGNTTWQKPKKPWRLKFDKKTSVLGLEAAKSWVLLANWQDPTLVMNEVAFEFGRLFGVPYTNNSRFVEIWINGTYRGNYQLTEQVQAGDGRVEIDDKNGGFLVELDTYWDSEPKFRTTLYDLPVMMKDPETAQGAAMAKEALEVLESSFAGGRWSDYADEEVFINYMLAVEMVRNPDIGQPKSLFMYRNDSSSKLCFGPMWDYDWSFGYAADNSFDYFRPKDMTVLYGPHQIETGQSGRSFFNRFFDDGEFCERYKARWNELRDEGAQESIFAFIDNLSANLTKSAGYNFGRWPNGKNHSEQIGMLKAWLSKRIADLDREINKF